MKVLVALLVVALFWFCSVAHADTVTFKNGSKIYGKAVIVSGTVVNGRTHLLKPGRMRVVFKNDGWFEFPLDSVKSKRTCTEVGNKRVVCIEFFEENDLDQFEIGNERPRPACCHEAQAEAKAEVKVQFKIESTNP